MLDYSCAWFIVMVTSISENFREALQFQVESIKSSKKKHEMLWHFRAKNFKKSVKKLWNFRGKAGKSSRGKLWKIINKLWNFREKHEQALKFQGKSNKKALKPTEKESTSSEKNYRKNSEISEEKHETTVIQRQNITSLNKLWHICVYFTAED